MDNAPPPDAGRVLSWALGLGLAGLTLAVFAQSIRFDFVNFDDALYVTENAHVTGGLTLQGIARVFTHLDCHFYHPLTMLSLMLDYQLHGLHAGGYHLTNALLHAMAAVLLFLVLRQMTGAPWRSAWAGALFAIHPLRVESVAWVAERKDVLATFFFMLTLAAYLHFVRKAGSGRRYGMVLAAFAAALLSKPTMVTLPFLLLLLDYWPLQRFTAESWRKLLLEKLPLLAMALAAAAITVVAEGREALPTLGEVPVSSRLGHALVSYVLYLRQFFRPSGLAVFYPLPAHGYAGGEVALSIITLLSITAAVLAFWRTQPWLFTGWLWYVVMLAPMSGLVQVGQFAHADRMTYLPEIGIAIAVVWLAAAWANTWHVPPVASGLVAGATILALAVCAWRQTSFWKNDETLWTHTLACTSENSLAHLNLGTYFLDHQKTQEALTQLRLAAQLEPTLAYAHLDLGNALFTAGQRTEAIAQFRQALQINPALVDGHNNLANALFQTGQTNEAMSQFQEALKLNPDDVNTLNNLGDALRQEGKTDDAVGRLQHALNIKPNSAEIRYNLALAFRQQRRIDDAIAQFQKAAQIAPDFARAHCDLGLALSQKGRLSEAMTELQRAVEIKPGYAEAHFNLGTVFLQTGKLGEAAAEYQKSLQIKPDYIEAHVNLGNIMAQSGAFAEALEHFQRALQLAPDNPMFQNSAAWLLATCPETSLRNGPKALELARKANAAAAGANPMILHTLAAALAECGQFDEARVDAQKAIALAHAAGLTASEERFEGEYKRYQARLPLAQK